MRVLPGREARVAEVLRAMARGEEIAARAAAGQAALVTREPLARALLVQARHERVHAAAFAAAARLSDARERHAMTPLDSVLDQFGRAVDADLAAGRLAATAIAVQGVLEGLGETMLVHMAGGATRRGAMFATLHRRFLAHERAHHALGRRLLHSTGLAADAGSIRAAAHYADLGTAMLAAGAELCAALGPDPESFAQSFRAELVAWMAAPHP